MALLHVVDHDPVPILLLNTHLVDVLVCVIATMGFWGKQVLMQLDTKELDVHLLMLLYLESVAVVTLAVD